jgi:hypothetical protein
MFAPTLTASLSIGCIQHGAQEAQEQQNACTSMMQLTRFVSSAHSAAGPVQQQACSQQHVIDCGLAAATAGHATATVLVEY